MGEVKAGEAYVEITGKDTGLKKTLNSAKSNLKSFETTALQVGKGLASIGVATALAIAGPLKAAADYEVLNLQFKNLLGSAEKAKAVLRDIAKFSLETPFTPEQVNKAGKSLLGFGVATENLIPTLKTLGNISATSGKDLGELAAIFGKAKASGVVFTEDLNQLSDAAVVVGPFLAKSMGVAESSLRKLASEGKISFQDLANAFELMGGKSGKFSKAMIEQSKTMTGLVSTLLGAIELAKIDIGDVFLEDAKKIAKQLIDIADYTVQWVKENKDIVKSMVKLGLALGAVGFALIGIVGTLKVMAILFGPAGVMGLAIVAILSILDALDVVNLGIDEMVGNFRIGGQKISSWIGAAFLNMEINWMIFKDNILAGWEFIQASFTYAGAKIREGWNLLLSALVGGFADSAAKIESGLNKLIEGFNSIAKTKIEPVSLSFTESAKGVQDELAKSASKAASDADKAWTDFEKKRKKASKELAIDVGINRQVMRDLFDVPEAKAKAEAEAGSEAKAKTEASIAEKLSAGVSGAIKSAVTGSFGAQAAATLGTQDNKILNESKKQTELLGGILRKPTAGVFA